MHACRLVHRILCSLLLRRSVAILVMAGLSDSEQWRISPRAGMTIGWSGFDETLVDIGPVERYMKATALAGKSSQ